MATVIDYKNIDELILKVKNTNNRLVQGPRKSIHSSIKFALINAKKASRYRGINRVFPNRNFLQRSIVKISYSKQNAVADWQAHGRYLQRESVEINKEHVLGYDRMSNQIDVGDLLADWQAQGDCRFFKIIVSPENAHELDLSDHVKQLMSKMEYDLGSKLEWAAVNHYNTGSFHSHIVLRTLDGDGKEFMFNREYLKSGLREHSMNIATKELGFRLRKDIVNSRDKAIYKDHITELDREIHKKILGHNEIEISLKDTTYFSLIKHKQVIQRIEYLSEQGMARKTGDFSWKVDDDFMDRLKAKQLTQDIIKARTFFGENIKDKNLPLVYTELKNNNVFILGEIAGFNLHDTDLHKRFILLVGVDNKIHYLKMNENVVKNKADMNIAIGDMVYLEKKNFEVDEKEIKYNFIRNFGDMNGIVKSKEFEFIDTYIIEQAKVNKRIFEHNREPVNILNRFYDMMKYRVNALKDMNFIDENYRINERKVAKTRMVERKLRISDERTERSTEDGING